PGASVVLTHGFTSRPLSTALRASRPAPIITDGLDVLVQLVMAAMTTWPWSSSNSVPSARRTGTRLDGRWWVCPSWVGDGVWLGLPTPVTPSAAAGGSLAGKLSAVASSGLPLGSSGRDDTSASANIALESVSGTRSWGRAGPAMDGTTVDRSSSRCSEYTGSGDDSSSHMPCSLAYASTSATCSAGRPVNSRYRSVSRSMGKMAHVEPYSGDMLPMVARSARGTPATPGP